MHQMHSSFVTDDRDAGTFVMEQCRNLPVFFRWTNLDGSGCGCFWHLRAFFPRSPLELSNECGRVLAEAIAEVEGWEND